MLRIVHLSDIHFNKGFMEESNAYIVNALKDDLKNYHDENKIDIIIFSGDLVDKAGESFDNDIDIAFLSFEENFIKPIIEYLSFPPNRVFFAPGNHDMAVKKDSEKDEVWLLEDIKTTIDANRYIKENNTKESKRVLPFFEFNKSFIGDVDIPQEIYNVSPFECTYKISIDNKFIGITCFNSAWRCYSSDRTSRFFDKSKLILGEYQITRSKKIIDDCCVKIAVMHHGYEWYKEFDKNVIENRMINTYDILLEGHNHRANGEQRNSSAKTIYISSAPMNWSGNINADSLNYSNGYTIIDYTENKILSHHRRYSPRKETYVPNNEVGNDLGIDSYNIPSKAEIEANKVIENFHERIKCTYYSEIDQNVLTSMIETNAPDNFDGIYVEPTIVKRGGIGFEGENKDIDYILTDLINSSENYIINGSKESGKTSLLNKLLKNIIGKNAEYRTIPIYIDFKKIGSKKIENIICSFTGFNKNILIDVLNKYNVIFLIDNISFKPDDSSNLIKMEQFLSQCSKKQIIATKNQKIEGIDPEILEYSGLFSEFTIMHIKDFSSKQIKQLIRNWFINSGTFNSENYFEKLVDIFIKFNIPRTPLTISMFLWVIEQQEDFRPVNHATMLENFIEKTFEKQSEIVFSKDFDYKNKERLLASIAYEMYIKGDDDYCFSYEDMISYIGNYITNRRFSFKSDKILYEFIKRGILSESHSNGSITIQFRFESFFKYFLMKHMDFDDKFKEYVLSDDNYYMFTDEIDYYTAIKRDQVSILSMVVNNMKEIYSELTDKIEKLDKNYDLLFDDDDSVVININESTLHKAIIAGKPTEDQMDSINDKILESNVTHRGILHKKRIINPFEKMAEIMLLSAKLLKNTEEIDDGILKDNCFLEIIRCSMAYAVLYKSYLVKKLNEKREKNENIDPRMTVMNGFLPLLHQIVLYNSMGTEKLALVIKDRIESNMNNEIASDFERFITLFLYSDIKGPGYEIYIHKFIKQIRRNYIYDMVLFKVISYYYFRSKNRHTNLVYERMIAELLISSKKRKKTAKGEIMQEFRDKKLIRKNESGLQQ